MTICNMFPHMTNRNDADEVQHLTREEAATALRVSLSTVDRYLRYGTLPKVKLGSRLVRIDRAHVDALLKSSPSSVVPPADGGAFPHTRAG